MKPTTFRKLVPTETIANRIYVIRGHKVMVDKDLAKLYKVTTKRLNEQVRRNKSRFPADFMFQLAYEEAQSLRSQIATLDEKGRGRHRKYLPYVFTEQGVAMLSSVLNSERAIQVNIAIMRAFVELREFALTYKELAQKLAGLEQKVGRHDKEILAIFKALRQLMSPSQPELPKRRIGFHGD